MNCPFCGVATDVPHDTQEACIEALHAEIGRVRSVLHRMKPPDGPASPRGSDDEPDVIPRSA